MANKIGLISAGLAVASGAMMTYIITTETFAVATLGGDESCELGTLGVFTSSYTPDCDPSKPGEPFDGEPTLEFWPLFSSQNAFGGAFESLGVPAQEELPEGWPSEEYDCEAGVNGYLDSFAAGTEALWATVDGALQGVFYTLLQEDPLNPFNTTTSLNGRLKPAVIGVAAGTFGDSQVLDITFDENYSGTIPAAAGGAPGADATIAGVSSFLDCAGTPSNKVTCFYLDAYVAATECTNGANWLDCLQKISDSVIDVDFKDMFGGTGAGLPNDYGPLSGIEYVSDIIAGAGDPIAAATVTAGLGLLNACYRFGYANFNACLTDAIPEPTGTGLAGLPTFLNEPHILGCLFTGLDAANPLQGIPPGAVPALPFGKGCLGVNAGRGSPGAYDADYATTYQVFQRLSVDEILPIAPAGTEALVAELGTFAAIISGCGDLLDTLEDLATQSTAVQEAECPKIVGDHLDGLDATADSTHDSLKNGGCASALVIDPLKAKATCISSTSRWAVPQQVIEGVYSIDPPTRLYTFETFNAAGDVVASPANIPFNKKLIADAAIPKCKDDNEDAQAIEQAQKLTPVGVALTFVGAVAGLVVAAMGGKVPKFAPVVPAVIVLTGAVIFMVALLGVRNAPVYELVGQPCPDGNTCYAAGTGNKMALPAILIALVSGLGLVVSVFVGGSGEDYSSFKETQVGMKA